jgi:hypothetical protein
MEEPMPAPSGNTSESISSRLDELGIVLPSPPTPLGAYVEASDSGDLLFISGTLPIVNRKLAIAGRLGENLSVKEGQEAARIASLNALAADGASDLFVKIFGPEAGHVRLVYGVQSLPIGAPLIVDVIFAIEPARESTPRQQTVR